MNHTWHESRVQSPRPYNIHRKSKIDSYTGETLTAEPVSPLVIGLRLPETLVLAVRTTGRFLSHQWSRNGVPAGQPDQLLDYGDVYISKNTTTADLGAYELYLNIALGSGQIRPDTIIFNVIEAGRNIRQFSIL